MGSDVDKDGKPLPGPAMVANRWANFGVVTLVGTTGVGSPGGLYKAPTGEATERRSSRKVLFPVHRYESSANNREWDVMPDDQTFVFFRQSGAGELNLVLNWFEELRARMKARP